MSDISARLISDPQTGITLNAQVFAAAVSMVLFDEFTGAQARIFLNDHLAENQAPALTVSEESDIGGPAPSLQATYDALPNAVEQGKYHWKLLHLTQQLQDGRITEFTWDQKMGL